jgi:hypothetical protein
MDTQDRITSRFTNAQDRLVLQASDLSLETIAAMVDRWAIDVAPEFQRRERWDVKQQSSLIESFLLNVPVPPVYLMEDDFGTYSVIDGKQRITTIRDFMRNVLVLKDLETFKEIEGLRFRDLPRALRNALDVRPYLRVVTLLKQSDPGLKYEVFTRLNMGGEPLNAQEIRNVVFRGPLNDLLLDLAKHPFLHLQLKIRNVKSPAFMQMSDVEFVLRFLTLRGSLTSYTGNLRRAMDEFMTHHRQAGPDKVAEMRQSFLHSIEGCQRLWDDLAFKRPEAHVWRHQMLAGMYDAQMIAVAFLTPTQIDTLASRSGEVVEATRLLFEDSKFDEAVRRATNNLSNIQYRVRKMKESLELLLS